jgi:hypothetical protein
MILLHCSDFFLTYELYYEKICKNFGGGEMEPRILAKQMLEFYKTSFENSFNAMIMLQEQMEGMAKMFLGPAMGLPDEGQKACEEWIKTYKTACAEFKKTVDESFKVAERFFAEEG